MRIFRKATIDDTKAIQQIYNENHVSSGGMLVGDLSQTGLRYVVEGNKGILGYVDIQTVLPERITEDTMFISNPCSLFTHSVYVKQVAVSKQHQGEGIGSLCYQEIQAIYSEHSLFAFVHLTNTQSMCFHTSNGFIPIGMYFMPNYYQVKNYTAFLLCLDKRPVIR